MTTKEQYDVLRVELSELNKRFISIARQLNDMESEMARWNIKIIEMDGNIKLVQKCIVS